MLKLSVGPLFFIIFAERSVIADLIMPSFPA